MIAWPPADACRPSLAGPHATRILGMMMTYKIAGHHANVGYWRDARRDGMLWVIAGTIRRPNATFMTISHDPGSYLASSVAIFAIVCLVSALSSTIPWFESDSDTLDGLGNWTGHQTQKTSQNESDSDTLDGLGNGASVYARSLVSAILRNLVFIAAIFWIGGRFGENHKFKDMFPVLSYCLIPVAFHAAASLGMQLLVLPGYMHGGVYLGGGSLDPDPSLSPSYGLDFAGSLGIILIQNAFTAFFMIWAFVLFVKAMKVSHGFETGKAVGVMALAVAATYALTAVLATGGHFLLPLSP